MFLQSPSSYFIRILQRIISDYDFLNVAQNSLKKIQRRYTKLIPVFESTCMITEVYRIKS